MLLVDSFAQNYRWSMNEILNMTMPQIYMLTAAATANRERLDKKMSRRETSAPRPDIDPNRVDLWHGKPIDQLNSTEYQAYFMAVQLAARA